MDYLTIPILANANSILWIGTGMVFLGILFLVLFFIKKMLYRKKQYKVAFEKVLLLVSLPQEVSEKEEKKIILFPSHC